MVFGRSNNSVIPEPENSNPIDKDVPVEKDEFLDDEDGERDTFKVTPKLETIKQKKKAPAEIKTDVKKIEVKKPVEKQIEEKIPGAKETSKMPRLEVNPLNVDRTITWKAVPKVKRLKLQSRFSNPVVARSVAPLKQRAVSAEIHIAQK